MTQAVTVATPETAPPRSRSRWRAVSIAAAAFVALSAVRLVTGQSALTDSGTIQATLAFAVPIGMAGLGGLWAERAGVINIGLEGMMVFGTWFGAYAAWSTGNPWLGLVAGVLGGVFGGLIHAVATVTFGVDHIVSGVAINILAVGAMRYLSILYFQDTPGGGASQSPPLPGFPRVGLPFVADVLGPVQDRGWFLVSDLAGLVIGLTTGMSAVTLLAILLVPASFFILWRTPFGLRLRSCGENPDAAESLGVPVYRYKYIAVLVSGGLSGLGGVFLAMVASSIYQEGQTGGRGYIGLAAMIFGNWRPGGLAMGAGLFGYTDALQVRGSGTAVHALLLLIAIALVAVAVWQWRRGKPVVAAVSLAVAALLTVWYLTTDTLPRELVTYSPHVATLLVLALAAQRLRAPAAIGRQWRRS
ncbi:simple sugar transport system permease protein [Spinactinospora alkalitolerans]|uniref:Simple sugar transport system permease protein n=1 Tax=Spinactinospora alkalitolerans TaxID=687207 RepID=A0A852TWJ0_9ACTN|nr:ABC transporter permease [Spinactinospora alkalitolerans]NYE46220.1 simple sugar transport system permease protein [Spinactinospora alkalitolerans]